MALGKTSEDAQELGMERWIRNVWEGYTVESCNAHLTQIQLLSKEDKSFLVFFHKAGPQMQMNYFTCCSLKNNNAREKKNQAVLDLGEMVQYIQNMCAIFRR